MNKIINTILELEKKDRIILFLVCSMIGNFIVGLIKLAFALTLPSMWFFVNSIFSFTLANCRFLTIKKYNKIRKIEDNAQRLKLGYNVYINNGILLIFIGIAYFFVSSYMYYKGTHTNMHEYISYLVALFAFSSIGTAIYGMVKYKRNSDPIIKGVKITNFANALTSIVLTQVVLLDIYAKDYDSTINGYTGMGVSLIIIILGLSMIITAKNDN